MNPALVIPLDLAHLRRCNETGDVQGVLTFAERLLPTEWRSEAVSIFYARFWEALEDEALCEQAGDLDALVGKLS